MGRRLPALIISAAGALGAAILPASAGAHSLVRVSGPELSYVSSDAVSLNTLVVRTRGGRVEFRDPSVEGGLDPGPCDPGEITDDANFWVIQVFCSASGMQRVRVELGDREDAATIAAALPARISGGTGADRITGGPAADAITGDEGDDTVAAGGGGDQVNGGDGDDRLDGGAGSDVVEAGLGVDVVAGGDGDDDLRARDGLADEVGCGAGVDVVDADTLDTIAADCERVTRTPTPPPADAGTRNDRTAPQLRVGGATLQRARRGRFTIKATSSEPGTISGSGFLDVNGISLPLSSNRKRVTVAGAGVTLTVRLSGRQLREARRAWRRGRRVTARLGIVATDRAGNSVRGRMPAIRLLAP